MQPQALRQYQRASELEPSQAEHYYNLATVQRFLGDFDASEANLDQGHRTQPDGNSRLTACAHSYAGKALSATM